MTNNLSYLVHHGILGQKWGVRRYQNLDGSLTAEGRKHYEKMDAEYSRKSPYLYKRASEDKETIIKKAKENIKQYQKELEPLDPIKDRKKIEKLANKELEEDIKFSPLLYGYKLTKRDVMALENGDGITPKYDTDEKLYNNYVNSYIKTVLNNPAITEHNRKQIEKYKRVVDKFSNESLAQLYEEASYLTSANTSLWNLYNKELGV